MFTEIPASDDNREDLSKFLQIMNIFGRGETNVTSHMVSQELNISINNASRRLKILMGREWLKRKKNPNLDIHSGYVYNLRKEGLETLKRIEERDLPRPCSYTLGYLLNLALENKINFDWHEYAGKY